MIYLLLTLLLAILPAQGELVLVKDGSSEYHRPHCEVVRSGVGVLAMTRAQAESRGLNPHAACDPEKSRPPASAGPPAAPGAKTVPATVYVFVDASGKHYHREGCKRLGKAPRKLALDQAGKKYWPCPVCRPPIRPRKR